MTDSGTPHDESRTNPVAMVARGPMGIELPPQTQILREVRVLIGDGDMRVPKVAALVIQDPVLTLELIKIANATFFSGDRPPITSVTSAIVRLGSGAIIDTLEHLAARATLTPPMVATQFEILRTLSREVSAVANIISSFVARDLMEVAETGGLLSYVGHLVACAYLGERYTEICASRQVASLTYKLQQDYDFDVRSVQTTYLRMRGVPQTIMIGLDRDIQCKSAAQANLRFIVQGAMELVEAAHSGKWEKYAPSHPLPGKSNLRLLKLSETQYSNIHEAVTEFFKTHNIPAGPVEREAPHESHEAHEHGESSAASSAPPSGASSVEAVLSRETDYVTKSTAQVEEDSNALSEDGKRIVSVIQQLCANCRTTNDLLMSVMNLLISDGPYSRAALILLTQERQSALIHTAIGQGLENGSMIAVEDPLSPLALCLTKISSFNCHAVDDTISPLGITSFAISPIRIKYPEPVVLYADCGIDRPLPLEARKIFRLVVGLLNRILPELTGGLPRRNFRSSEERVHRSA